MCIRDRLYGGSGNVIGKLQSIVRLTGAGAVDATARVLKVQVRGKGSIGARVTPLDRSDMGSGDRSWHWQAVDAPDRTETVTFPVLQRGEILRVDIQLTDSLGAARFELYGRPGRLRAESTS